MSFSSFFKLGRGLMGISITTKVKVYLIAEDATAVCTVSEECRLKLKINKKKTKMVQFDIARIEANRL